MPTTPVDNFPLPRIYRQRVDDTTWRNCGRETLVAKLKVGWRSFSGLIPIKQRGCRWRLQTAKALTERVLFAIRHRACGTHMDHPTPMPRLRQKARQNIQAVVRLVRNALKDRS